MLCIVGSFGSGVLRSALMRSVKERGKAGLSTLLSCCFLYAQEMSTLMTLLVELIVLLEQGMARSQPKNKHPI